MQERIDSTVKITKSWFLIIAVGFLAVAFAYWKPHEKVQQIYEGAYGKSSEWRDVAPTAAEVQDWNANDVRRYFESKDKWIPPEYPGATIHGRFFPREHIYGNPLITELGLRREVKPPPGY